MLVGLTLVAGAALHVHPGRNALDRLGFGIVGAAPGSPSLSRITDLAAPGVLVVGTLLAALVAWRRDRLRAVACLVGPVVVAGGVEAVLKPLVGRRFEGVLSYPSGNVADLAAVATAWTVAVGTRLRPFVAALAALAVGAMAVAVTGLRWHEPTDALGGAAWGVGAVLLLDGALHLPRGAASPVAAGGPGTATGRR